MESSLSTILSLSSSSSQASPNLSSSKSSCSKFDISIQLSKVSTTPSASKSPYPELRKSIAIARTVMPGGIIL